MHERAFLQATIDQFRVQKSLADRAMAQINDEQFFSQLDPESNSIAMIVKHVAGNLRSRWTDFLETDGEKPTRRRDAEFLQEETDSRTSLIESWEAGWQCVLDSLEELAPSDLIRQVRIASEPHNALQAIQRSLAHTAQHAGQIVLLAKHFAGQRWQTLSIPRGQSEEHNRKLAAKYASGETA